MEELKPCPRCRSEQTNLHDYHGDVAPICWKCRLSGPYLQTPDEATEWWNTRADPLIEKMKDELKRLYIKQDEDRFAALADDSVPRLVFHAAIEAIANKDTLMEEMEQLRVQLAGCGVAALSNTHKSREQQRINPGDYGYSESYQDVFDAVGREIKYRELLEEMARALEELDDMFDPTSRVGEIINNALQKYRERGDANRMYINE